ncbi:MAG: DUF2163 domain-containing protein [Pseudomonadota bacterium]|nr:DUF2163 domain-containing protein [Pseudomonadota bacterium]
MKTASAPLIALIGTGVFSVWHLYTITLAGGLVLRLTSADFDITDNVGNRYLCGIYGSASPRIDAKSARVTAHIKAGLDPDSWQVSVMPLVMDIFTGTFTYPDLVGGTPWLQACQSGLFDGATVTVQAAYFAAPPALPWTVANTTCVGTTIEFAGYLGQIDADVTTTNLTFTGWGGLLSDITPPNVYQAGCRHQLFDAGCTLSAGAYVKTGTALAGSTKTILKATPAAPSGSGSYQLGKVSFTSGQNSGFSRLIAAWDGVSTFTLLYPLPFTIGIGDTFNVYPGCDKSLGAGGCGGFANTVNFDGTPNIPLPEIIIG